MKRLSTILLSFVIFMSLMPIQTGVFVFADDNSADALAKAKAEYEQAQNDYNEYLKKTKA